MKRDVGRKGGLGFYDPVKIAGCLWQENREGEGEEKRSSIYLLDSRNIFQRNILWAIRV